MEIEHEISNLREKGFRITLIRKALLKLFYGQKQPLTVSGLRLLLEAAGINADKTTIYRELHFLKKQSLILEVEMGDGKKRYEACKHGHHHHLVCQNCTSIEDIIPDRSLELAIEKISAGKSFKIKSHILEFFGLCKNCYR